MKRRAKSGQSGHRVALILTTVIVAGTALVWTTTGHSREMAALLETRAERMYRLEKTAHLPAHRLRALSIALKFGDYSGADAILTDLEERARLAPR